MTEAISQLFFLKYFNWTTIMKIDLMIVKENREITRRKQTSSNTLNIQEVTAK